MDIGASVFKPRSYPFGKPFKRTFRKGIVQSRIPCQIGERVASRALAETKIAVPSCFPILLHPLAVFQRAYLCQSVIHSVKGSEEMVLYSLPAAAALQIVIAAVV